MCDRLMSVFLCSGILKSNKEKWNLTLPYYGSVAFILGMCVLSTKRRINSNNCRTVNGKV